MDQSTLYAFRLIMATLYLRGLPRFGTPPRKSWIQIENLIRKADISPTSRSMKNLINLLLKNGYWLEARILESDSLLHQAESLIEANEVLTLGCEAYPRLWRTRLGQNAPIALWSTPEAIHLLQRPTHTIVGSRQIKAPLQQFAAECGRLAAEAGYVILTGGAPGSDRFAAVDENTIEIWPSGLKAMSSQWGSGTKALLSMSPPQEPFSSNLAMERNHLLYAASSATHVIHARYLVGGSWHGAVHALRKRVCPVLVPRVATESLSDSDLDTKGPRALLAIGASVMNSPSDWLVHLPSLRSTSQLELPAVSA